MFLSYLLRLCFYKHHLTTILFIFQKGTEINVGTHPLINQKSPTKLFSREKISVEFNNGLYIRSKKRNKSDIIPRFLVWVIRKIRCHLQKEGKLEREQMG